MKHTLSLLFGLFVTLILTIAASAVSANLPTFDVTLNGVKVENQNREYPLIVYKDITYFPMTYYDCRFLGLITEWDNDTRTLYINKETITCAYRDQNLPWANGSIFDPIICDFNIIVNGKVIDNSAEEYPLLTFRDITYFPLTWRFAYEEFEWDYSFTSESGLVINSDNDKTKIITLPNIQGSAALDDQYYYYNGSIGEKNYIYRAPISEPSKAEIIYEMPNTPLSRQAAFVNSSDGTYIQYISGSSPVMSTRKFYKINSDGTVTEGYPDKYWYGSHGYTEVNVRNENISVKAATQFPGSSTVITYTKDGKTVEAPVLPGRVSLGCRIDGNTFDRIPLENCIKIFGDKIYYTAFDYEQEKADSNLYVIDMTTGENQKILDGVCGFHVYTGWVNDLDSDSTMIIYGVDGKIMRYTEKNREICEVHSSAETAEMILEAAAGDYQIYTLQKSLDGSKTIVQTFDCYASGQGSVNATIFQTATGTTHTVYGNRLVVCTFGESPNDTIRTIVLPWNDNYLGLRTSDVISSIYIYGDTVLYTLSDNTVVLAELKN